MPIAQERRTSVIRAARHRRGIGVRELARRARVTPGAVTQWEDSEERGTIRPATLERALRAMGTTFESESPAPLPGRLERREDRVALELHREVARKLIDDPEHVLAAVPANVEKLRSRLRGPAASAWLDEWSRLAAARRLGALVDVMLGTDPHSIDMRQASPFAGVLSQGDRLRAIERGRV